ncbi:MAG: bis(5'-nucleosyl)-tetraphosphatase (symmetrical) YqeK [Ruminococcus sp.]|jgi:nicotinate-nucleotide adenylyltransferase|nr:bis(5'-nucleosyl)-tetraphosphatase (symmetrical) YqeK [Ruminococcus sp.]
MENLYSATKKEDYIKLISARLSQKRVNHSLSVADMAVKLSKRWGYDDLDKAYCCGLLHDICKNEPDTVQLSMAEQSGYELVPEVLSEVKLLHAPAGAFYCKTFLKIDDTEFLDAVRWHTEGHAAMSKLEKIIFAADTVGLDRDFPDIESYRKLAFDDLNRFIVEYYAWTFFDLLKKQSPITASQLGGYNYYLYKIRN